MKWIVETNKLHLHKHFFMFIPCLSVWYDKYRFLETGVYTKAFGISLGWFNLSYNLTIQQGY